MKVVPLTSFVHGSISAEEGRPIEIPDGTAVELERAGLVRIRPTADKAVASGKPQDDGQGQPSSSSPAAPASPITTSTVSKRGGKKGGKKEK